MKKFSFFTIFILLASFLLNQGFAEQKNYKIYLFYSDRCFHCKKEKAFLSKLKEKRPEVEIQYIESVNNKQNRLLYEKFMKSVNLKIFAFPVTIVKDKYFIGFSSNEGTGKEIENALDSDYYGLDLIQKIQEPNQKTTSQAEKNQEATKKKVYI